MPWISLFAVLFACNRVEPLDTEQICDGLDDDQDGLIDEGLFITTVEFALDEADVIDLDRGLALRESWVPGIEQRTEVQISSSGDVIEEHYEYDALGNILAAEVITTSESGEVRVVHERRYQGSEVVYNLRERFDDGEAVSRVETVIELTDSGQMSTLREEDFTDEEVIWLRFSYDAQDREILLRQEGPEELCVEWSTVYDDDLMQSYAYEMVLCDAPLPDEPVETRTWDSQGRLLSIQEAGEGPESWTWEGDLATSYTSYIDATRSFNYQEGRLVSATGEGHLASWALDYDELGRLSGYTRERSDGPAGVSLTYAAGEGSSLSKISGQYGGEDSYERSYEVDELGNLLSGAYEDLVSGAKTETTYSYTCQAAE